MANRMSALARIRAYPADALFSWPLSPEYMITDFLSNYGTQNLDGSDVIETWVAAECITPRRRPVSQTQFVEGVPNIPDLLNPFSYTDPRGTEGTNINLWWTELAFSKNYEFDVVRKEYKGAGSASYDSGDLQQFFKYPCYHHDSRNGSTDPGFSGFTLVANTDLDWVQFFDPYGVPTLGGRQRCQGFSASLTRGNYAVQQDWDGSDPEGQYQTSDLQDWKPLDLHWVDDYTYLTVPTPPYQAIRFRVACGEDAKWFEIKFPAIGPPELYVSDDENFASKSPIQPLKSSATLQKPFGQSSDWVDVRFARSGSSLTTVPLYRLIGSKTTNNVQVTLIGGFLHVEVEGEVQPFLWDMRVFHSFDNIGYSGSGLNGECLTSFRAGDPIGLIEQIKVVFNNVCYAEWYVHLTKWDTQSILQSKQHNIGFGPPNLPTASVHLAHYVPDVYEIDTNIANAGTLVSYTLTMTNDFGMQSTHGGAESFADETVAVRAVSIHWDEVLRNMPGIGVELYPEDCLIHHQFSLDDLNIQSKATLVFNNYRELASVYGDRFPTAPQMFWGEWSAYNGLFAIEIDVMTQMFSTESGGDTLVYQSPWRRQFTGYANVESTTVRQQGGRTVYVMECQSRELPMMSAKMALPWMDGWNEYYAAAYLANISGVKRGTLTDTDLAFRDRVPASPFDDSPGGGAYFLPMGDGGMPLMKPAVGSKPWEFLGRIGRNSGFVRYFDVDGKFHWEKFDPAAQKPDVVLYVDFHAHSGFQAENAVFEGSVHRSLRDVRNKVAVIGIDAAGPLWFPVVSVRTDTTSLYGNHSIFWDMLDPIANFMGFESAFVWADSQFANLPYAARAADEVFRVMRMPNASGRFTSWINLDIAPGTWLGVVDVHAGTFNRVSGDFLPLLTTGVTHHIRKGAPPTTTSTTRYIPMI